MDFIEFQNKFMFKTPEHAQHKVSAQPLVSICVQTYQHVNYIKNCLDSILEQKTDFEYEILLGEDKSSDGTREICIQYAQRFPEKIRLFLHHDDNKIKVENIPTGNFNAFYNFYQARGKFIAFCEGDDFWRDPLKLQKQVDFLQINPEYVLAYHNFEEKFESLPKEEKQRFLKKPSKDLTQEELSGLIYHPLLSTVCFRNCLSRLPEEMIQVINVDSFLLSMLGTIGKAKFQSDIQASVYRRHSGGIWTKKNREIQLLTKILLFKNLASYYKSKDRSLMSSFQKDLKNTGKMLLVLYLKDLKPFKAMKLSPGLL